MANRKAGSGDGGNTGAKRSAAGKKGSGAASGDAAQGTQGEETTGALKQASSEGAAAATGGGTAAESQPARSAKRAPAKGAAKSASGGGDAAGAQGATKGAAKGGARGAAKGATKSAGQGGGGKPDLSGDLRQFVTDNPQGWGHQQWEGLLSQLGQRGHDTSNPAEIGMQLERERLSSRLQGIEGLSQQHARSIIEHFGTLYSLRQADADEIARASNVSPEVARRIQSQLH